jgi:hypothetical protein
MFAMPIEIRLTLDLLQLVNAVPFIAFEGDFGRGFLPFFDESLI